MVMPSSTSSLTNALKKATSRFMSAVWNQPNPAIAYESLCLVIRRARSGKSWKIFTVKMLKYTSSLSQPTNQVGYFFHIFASLSRIQLLLSNQLKSKGTISHIRSKRSTRWVLQLNIPMLMICLSQQIFSLLEESMDMRVLSSLSAKTVTALNTFHRNLSIDTLFDYLQGHLFLLWSVFTNRGSRSHIG